MIFFKRQLPLILTFVVGMGILVQYYIPHETSEEIFARSQKWIQIVWGFALVLGVSSLCHIHLVKVRQRRSGWQYSILVFLGMLTTLIAGFWVRGDEKGTMFGWIYTYLLTPLSATMFSLLAFFIASAAFRAFRARTVEAAMLLTAAIVMMFGRVPLGEYLWELITEIPTMSQITEWILTVPSMAAKRAIRLGVSLGVVATSLRIILGIERSYLGGKE